MKFDYTFEGIETSKGEYPRAIVVVRPDQATAASIDEGLWMPGVKITLPLGNASREQTLGAIAAQTLESAHSLLNESALSDWLSKQGK